ncbi:MAG TPA: 3-hydroxyacyl-CoA dehydrogenase [Planctomycetota bacterium]|nr:3-hydroxyacyl-CoA dehydrogenase [Planctomycetota bacterium]
MKIAVIGAGRIGRAWSMTFARAGHSVALFDALPGVAASALPFIVQGLKELRRFDLLAEAPDKVAARVRATETLAAAVGDADYVQENTPEQLDLKIGVYRQLDDAAPPDCILASSTSTFRASQFSESLKGRDRCIVAHPVNPPHVIPLVEIAPAPWTRADVVSRTRQLMHEAGQTPILLRKEVDGFVLNRLQAALLREAFRLVDEGVVSVEDLDRCVKDGLGLRWSFMGPFETIDLNAPEGVADYARRYGAVFHALFEGVNYQPWGDALVSRVEGERRALLTRDRRASREAWRDSRLMALLAHRRDCERKER